MLQLFLMVFICRCMYLSKTDGSKTCSYAFMNEPMNKVFKKTPHICRWLNLDIIPNNTNIFNAQLQLHIYEWVHGVYWMPTVYIIIFYIFELSKRFTSYWYQHLRLSPYTLFINSTPKVFFFCKCRTLLYMSLLSQCTIITCKTTPCICNCAHE